MHSLKRQILFFLLLAAFLPLVSQRQSNHNDEKLAFQYFEQKEFEKANLYFDDMYDRSPDAIYPYYFKSLIGVKDYSKAEKITKKQLKQNRMNAALYVNLGKIYKLENDEKKEKES